MKIHNNTEFDLHDICESQLLLAVGRNEWRQRNLSLYAHPTDPERLISVGKTFDERMIVVADELRSDWRRELENAKHKGYFVTK